MSLSSLFSKRNQGQEKNKNLLSSQTSLSNIFGSVQTVANPKPKISQVSPINNNSNNTNVLTSTIRQKSKNKSQKKQNTNISQVNVVSMQEQKNQIVYTTPRKERAKSKKKKLSNNTNNDNQQNLNEQKQKQKEQQQQQQDLHSTIFIGNVPVDAKKSELRQIFAKYGQINKVWFRSIPVEKNKMGQKASYIMKKFIQNPDTMNAYIKFSNIQQAKQAVKQNGLVFKQKTLRISLCQQKDIDYQKTIFVGNLPFNLHEQNFRNHFKHIGKIENVRLIKNKNTHQGIGIGYVKFYLEQDMKKALKEMNGSQINNRILRVKRAVKKERLEKKIRKIKQRQDIKKGKGKPQLQEKNKFDSSDKPNISANPQKSKKIKKMLPTQNKFSNKNNRNNQSHQPFKQQTQKPNKRIFLS